MKQNQRVRISPNLCLIVPLFLAGLVSTVFGQTADAFDPEASAEVYAVAIQPDGKIWLGGYFQTLGGQNCPYLARVGTNGQLDPSVTPGANGEVYAVAIQDDGKILVGGAFGYLGGQPRGGLAGLKADGSLDAGFNPGVSGSVFCLAVQPDGRILVGGHFTQLAGQSRNNIGRLNADGSLDAAFNPGATQSSYTSVDCLALQPDGGILVGGAFTTLGGEARTNIGRLSADGTVDPGFAPQTAGLYYSFINAIAVQPDGKILVGGYFNELAQGAATNLARLNADGTLDPEFNSGADSSVASLALQVDGKILAGGSFTNLAGDVRPCIGRLNSGGTLDSSFDPRPTGGTYPYRQMVPYVGAIALQLDGKILCGGRFATLAGQARTNIGRLVNTAAAAESLVFDGTSISWLRSGTGPEVWRTRFDASTNGVDWFSVGPAARVPGGWRVSGLALPSQATVRVRGFTTGGYGNASSWSLEQVVGPPAITQEPESRTNNALTTATFSVRAVGTGSLSYHWLKNGLTLGDTGAVSGTQTPSLVISNVVGADAGGYSVVVTSPLGAVTSLVAQLTVIDPCILNSPTNTCANQGDTVQFKVLAVGTAPLQYEWRHDGTNLAGQTAASLSLTNVQEAHVGSYDVVVSNGFGMRVSATAILTINLVTSDSWSNGLPYLDSFAVLPDGRMIVAGWFSSFPTYGYPYGYVARLNANGSVDSNFRSGSYNCIADSLLLQTDGSFIIGGVTTPMAGESTESVRRLYPDGARDGSFNPGAAYEAVCLVEQLDGKIVVGGSISTLGGQPCQNLGRLYPDGTRDTSFNPAADGDVWAMALQPDGKIIVGGKFAMLAGQPRKLIGRLLPDGTLDPDFNPGADGDSINCLALQPDGKILVGGTFTALAGQRRLGMGRLNPNGSLDLAYDPALGGSTPQVYCVLQQADGRTILGGWFTSVGGLVRTNIARVDACGRVDLTFNPGPSSPISTTASYCLGLQPDGKLLVGGVARLKNTAPATQSLSVDGTGIRWLRGGCSPEVLRATFESSTDGTAWTLLGAGIRGPGGWRLACASLSSNATIRARGYLTGGIGNRSTWFVESTALVGQPRPVILTNDGALGFNTNRFGFNVAAILGQTIVIETSGDLVNWTAIATNTVSTSPFYFRDPAPRDPASGFYRAKVP